MLRLSAGSVYEWWDATDAMHQFKVKQSNGIEVTRKLGARFQPLNNPLGNRKRKWTKNDDENKDGTMLNIWSFDFVPPILDVLFGGSRKNLLGTNREG